MNLSSNVVDDSKDENNFPHELLLTNIQVSEFHKAFVNSFPANIKLSKTQLHKIGQSGGLLGRLLQPLRKPGLSLMKNVLKPFAKSALIPLRLTAAALVTDAAIHKNMFGSGMTKLLISNKVKTRIMKVVISLKESGLLIKVVNEM